MIIRLVIALVILIPIGLYALTLWDAYGPNPDAHMMLMPGKYRIKLDKGHYYGWTYTNWTSKQVQLPVGTVVPVHIVDSDGKEIEQQTEDKYAFNDGNHAGRLTASFYTDRAGEYMIFSDGDKRFVFSIVPSEQIFTSIGTEFAYPGRFSEFSFEKPLSK